MAKADHEMEQRIVAVRRFNRFYTKHIGLLDEGLLNSTFSLTEVRVMWELAHRANLTATDLGRELGVDIGYLSRILRRFTESGFVERQPASTDRRKLILALTRQGEEAFAPLNTRSRDQVQAMLEGLSKTEQRRLLSAMEAIERLVGARRARELSFRIRPARTGDLGWILQRYPAAMAAEARAGAGLESRVAAQVAHFLAREAQDASACFIADVDGACVGSAMIVPAKRHAARLQLLFVEPNFRERGIGESLVRECLRFAREAGYRHALLSDQMRSAAARHLFAKLGFPAPMQARRKARAGASASIDLTRPAAG